MRLKHLAIGAITLGLMVGVAYAATEWSYFKSDLVRCADTNNACGSAVTGTDPLEEGDIVVRDDEIRVDLEGATPNKTYRVIFVELQNDGTNALGPYSVPYPANFRTIGEFTTNSSGNGNAEFTVTATSVPRLGYFIVQTPDVSNEFVTGFDQL